MGYINLNHVSEIAKRLKGKVKEIKIEGTKVVLHKNNGQLPFAIECYNEKAANVCFTQFNKIWKSL